MFLCPPGEIDESTRAACDLVQISGSYIFQAQALTSKVRQSKYSSSSSPSPLVRLVWLVVRHCRHRQLHRHGTVLVLIEAGTGRQERGGHCYSAWLHILTFLHKYTNTKTNTPLEEKEENTPTCSGFPHIFIICLWRLPNIHCFTFQGSNII